MEIEALIRSRPAMRGQLPGWYRDVFQAADHEGLSVAELAGRLGCSAANLYLWRRRLRNDAEGEHAVPQQQLVRVVVADSIEAREVPRIEVRLRSGRSVAVPNEFDPAALAAVVEVLERC